jgi:hypothetical protein
VGGGEGDGDVYWNDQSSLKVSEEDGWLDIPTMEATTSHCYVRRRMDGKIPAVDTGTRSCLEGFETHVATGGLHVQFRASTSA